MKTANEMREAQTKSGQDWSDVELMLKAAEKTKIQHIRLHTYDRKMCASLFATLVSRKYKVRCRFNRIGKYDYRGPNQTERRIGWSSRRTYTISW